MMETINDGFVYFGEMFDCFDNSDISGNNPRDALGSAAFIDSDRWPGKQCNITTFRIVLEDLHPGLRWSFLRP